MGVCDEISIFVEFDIRYVFFFPPFFFDIRSKVHYSSPKKKKKFHHSLFATTAFQ